MRATDVVNVLLIVLGVIAAAIGVWWVMRDGDRDRDEEDAARTFIEEHGRWPDQSPEEAAALRRRSTAPPPLSEPDEDGRV